jgi:archaellum biogenesis protein FlaJ (TadC family)
LSIDGHIEEQAILAGEEVLRPQDRETEHAVQAQMDTLYQRDRWMAIVSVVAMLVVLPFTYIALLDNMPGTGTKVVLAAACVVLLVYNVASMLALVRNYRRDKDFIYRRDVAHLTELATARRAAKERA